jgi:uncharacterized membrane protein
MALFSFDGLLFLLRWGHFLAGVMWIGMLWYFNFVQGPFFAEAAADVKTAATQKLVPRALWYFRWGAMFTFLTGWFIILLRLPLLGTSWGANILTGAALGSMMWFNVWFVIWPRQKLVIAAANGQSVPDLPAVTRRAFLASRTNTLFSIPMLFFMGAASHLPVSFAYNTGWLWALIVIVIIGLIEYNALTASKGLTTDPIETVKNVTTSGFILTLIMYILLEVVL